MGKLAELLNPSQRNAVSNHPVGCLKNELMGENIDGRLLSYLPSDMDFEPAPRQSLVAASEKVPSPSTGRYSWFMAPAIHQITKWLFNSILLEKYVLSVYFYLPDSVAAKMAASAFLNLSFCWGRARALLPA